MKFAAVQAAQAARRSSTPTSGACASCCCWRCASRRCVLLALAFARPFFATGAGRRLDRRRRSSRSTRRTACRRPAGSSARSSWRRRRSRSAPAGDLVGVVTFADDAEIAAKPAADRALATAAIDAGARRIRRDALPRRAVGRGAACSAGRRGTIVVVTDLQESGWDAGDRASVPEATTIEVADVGALPPNLGGDRGRDRRPIASSRPFATRGRAARDARVHLTDRRHAPQATRPCRSAPNQSADATFAGAPRGAARRRDGRRSDGIQADNVRYAVLGGAGRPSVLVVTGIGDLDARRSTCSTRSAAGAPATRRLQVDGVGGAQLGGVDRRSAGAAGGRAAAVDARPRAARARAAGGATCATAAASHRRRPGRRRRRRRPTCSAPARRCTIVDGRAARSRRRARWRRPTCGIRSSRRSARNAATLGLVTFQHAARDRRRRLPDARAVHDRRGGADRVPGGRGARAGPRVGPRTTLERFPAARDVRAVPARSRAVSGERAAARGRLSRRRRAGRRARRRPASSTLPTRPARRRHAARRGERRSARVRSGAAVGGRFQSAVTRLKDAGASRRARRGAAAGGSAAPLAVRAGADGCCCWRSKGVVGEPGRPEQSDVSMIRRRFARCSTRPCAGGATLCAAAGATCARAGRRAASSASALVGCALDRRRAARARWRSARSPPSLLVAGALVWGLLPLRRAPDRRAGRALHRGARAVARRSAGHAPSTSSQPSGRAPPRCAEPMIADAARRARAIDRRRDRAARRRCAAPGSRPRPPRCCSLARAVRRRAVRRGRRSTPRRWRCFPSRVTLEVTPGNARDQGRRAAGDQARLVGNRAPVVAQLQIADGDRWRVDRDDDRRGRARSAWRCRRSPRRSSTASSPAR